MSEWSREPCSESGCVQVQRSAWTSASALEVDGAPIVAGYRVHDAVWLMRDGKNPDGGILVFGLDEWRAVTRGIIDSGLVLGALSVRHLADGDVLAFRTDAADAVVLRFTSGEWLAFTAGVRAGLFA